MSGWLSFVSFITQSFQSVIKAKLGYEVELWSIGIVLVMILAPISWVRNISKFSFTFLLGNTLILSTLIIVTVILTVRLYNRDWELGPGI